MEKTPFARELRLSLRLTEGEKNYVVAAAKKFGLRPASFARAILLGFSTNAGYQRPQV